MNANEKIIANLRETAEHISAEMFKLLKERAGKGQNLTDYTSYNEETGFYLNDYKIYVEMLECIATIIKNLSGGD